MSKQNRDKWISAATGAALAFFIAFGSLGAMVTGLRLEADMGLLAVACLALAAVFSVLLPGRWSLIPLELGVLGLVWSWLEGSLKNSMQSLLHQITDLLDQGYGWGVYAGDGGGADHTLALLAIGFLLCLEVSAGVRMRGWSWLSALLSLLPLASCLLLKDTVPAAGYFVMVLFGIVLLVLTAELRTRAPHKANRLAVLLALPVALGLSVLLILNPQKGYNGQEGAQRLEEFLSKITSKEGLTEIWQEITLPTANKTAPVELGALGERKQSQAPVLTLRASVSGPVYLRGCAYDVYDGSSWTRSGKENDSDDCFARLPGEGQTLRIQTRSVHDLCYFGYSPLAAATENGCAPNPERLQSYTVHCAPVPDQTSLRDAVDYGRTAPYGRYCILPVGVRSEAEALLKAAGVPVRMNTDAWKLITAKAIVMYVQNSADYDLKAETMPRDREDFALWFLQEQEKGYCVHFATSAAVLLRAVGLPARYVTGYMTDAVAGSAVTVTEADAHAWVEVYIGELGWFPLEPTPGGSTSIQPPVGTEPPATTEPSGTSAPPATTEPATEATDPDATAVQTDPQSTGTHPGTQPGEQTGPTADISTAGGADRPAKREDTGLLLKPLLYLAGLLAAAGAVLLQWRLRLALLERSLSRGTANQQLLRRYRLLERLCACEGRSAPESCLALAQKARFSQHEIDPRELEALTWALKEQRGRLRTAPWLRRLWWRLGLAIL